MAFHAWLGAPADPQRLHPDTWLIYGIEYPTETRIGFQGVTPFPGVTPGGDGTVPVLSATALRLQPDRMMAIPGLEHSRACLDPKVRQMTGDLFSAVPCPS